MDEDMVLSDLKFVTDEDMRRYAYGEDTVRTKIIDMADQILHLISESLDGTMDHPNPVPPKPKIRD